MTEGGSAVGAAEVSGVLVASRFAWRYLDAGEAAELWDELLDWVGWLRFRYQLESRVKPCWFRHGAVVEELTALMVAHSAVYFTDTEQRGQCREDLTAWHTQWLWPVVDRLNKVSDFSGCGAAGCKHEPKPQSTLGGLSEFVAADLAVRSHTTFTLAPEPRGATKSTTPSSRHR